MKKQILPWILSLSGGLLLMMLTSVSKSSELLSTANPSESQINLALREIADQVLKQNQDVFSPIPPVRREDPNTYLIELKSPVNYALIRQLVDSTLLRHRIRPDYRLSLLDCSTDEVVLGFLAYAKDENKEVPCQQRASNMDNCYYLRLQLVDNWLPTSNTALQKPERQLRWWLMGLAILFPLLWMNLRPKEQEPTETEADQDGWQLLTDLTAFHPINQTLRVDQVSETLTYREAKLLRFFFEHPNQVLEREAILQAVWEDEGVIVGRSLDVFVSRLRKKLKGDPELNLVSVHGVGYRLEVK